VDTTEFERVLRLLGGLASNATLETRARKFQLMQGLCDIIGADLFMWTQIRIDQDGRPAAYSVIDGGWKSPQQRTEFIEFVVSSAAVQAEQTMFARLGSGTCFVAPLRELVPSSDPGLAGCRTLGIEPGLLGCYRVSSHLYSGVGFHRHCLPSTLVDPIPASVPGGFVAGAKDLTADDRPPMGAREAEIVALVMSSVEGLHREGADSPVTDRMNNLTDRQKTVLLLLLGGESRKQIARQLGLSEYTVADYIQALYRIFDVSSRAELMSLFMSGKTNAAIAPEKTATGKLAPDGADSAIVSDPS
jgi:DNA-binding CsgD family transcriptional regulator